MSSILEAALDPERRAACRANDEALAAGQPVTPASVPRAIPATPLVVLPVRRVLRIVALAVIAGIGIGHLDMVSRSPLRVPAVCMDPHGVRLT